ncbi:MAG: AmmeMemoRadiSam system radical SAM enzyme [Bacteroidaceae bacterium]|nr:AmmeMemoRadiSam system radical SAM enzyme [Bacteroidaceae bacterium]
MRQLYSDMKECNYYQTMDNSNVECLLCPHHCQIADGRTGRCRSRRNRGGRLYSDAYGRPCALAIDPVEKKPLYQFHPGTKCLSVACTGCNLSCWNCQNHEISQAAPDEVDSYRIFPQQLVDICKEERCPGIAFTYTEPLTYIEYVTDTARLAHKQGLWNILVTAGFVEKEPLNDLIPHIDAANIDLKSFSDEIYKKVNGGRLDVVLNTIQTMHEAGVWIELTNLLIPGVNDNMEMVRMMCKWMMDNGMAEVPLHFSRFFPRFKMKNVSPTPLSTMNAARDTALKEGIKTVYLGNV